MNRTINPGEDYRAQAREFCRENPQTAFLLQRLKAHDRLVYEHSLRSAFFSLMLARGLGLPKPEQDLVYRSALLMDYGKLLLAPARSGQPKDGAATVLDHPLLTVGALASLIEQGLIDREAILAHHENLDGTGYPYGLVWEDITLHARILRVADGFASMTVADTRNGKMTGTAEALGELYRWSDIQYDEDLVELLCRYYPDHVGKREEPVKAQVIKLINH
ncbi:HD domain-containing phosphohydrolase [Gorillibacterium sp. CAU 1737]|uniref:HD-GYP domain-containing protein n=1 Tax=Gorillibacterium sp. CAU 1737 TaxID=3140362 RepID=UPI00326170C5